MMVNLNYVLKKAMNEKYAVAHFNIMNLEWAKAILETANETNTPVICALTDVVSSYFGGYKVAKVIVETLIETLNIKVPVVLHLDHGSFEGCLKCIECGFTSIMFDGSKLSIDENVKKTLELVRLAHEKNISVEAEVGSIGGTEDGITGLGEIANISHCIKLANTNIDALACGIGNIHGKYPADWKGLSFDTLSDIKKSLPDIPLVLHGGSGIPKEQIKNAISHGITKINVNTELHIAFATEIRKYIESNLDKIDKGYDLRNISKAGMLAIKNIVKEKMMLFGSLGKA